MEIKLDESILIIFLLQIISIIFSIIEQKQIQFIMTIIQVFLIVGMFFSFIQVHVVLVNYNKLIVHSKILIFVQLLITQFLVYGTQHLWITIYICNLNKQFVILNLFGVISLLVFEANNFSFNSQKSFLQTILDIIIVLIFDIYKQYQIYIKNQYLSDQHEFKRIFNQSHTELSNVETQKYFSEMNLQNSRTNFVIQQQSLEMPHYQIYQMQDSVPSFKDLSSPEWKKTYICSTTQELLKIYDKETSHLFYILYFSQVSHNQREVYKVLITKNLKQQYILTYHKLDSLLYQKMKQSKKRFRQSLASIFSHKLKTPLNSALAKITQLLTDQNVSKQQKEILSQVYIQQKCQLYSILDFLDYVNSELLTCQFQKTTLNQLLSTSRDLIREQCKAKQINLKILIDNIDYKDYKEQIILNTDTLKLERILYNLLNNAYRYSNQHGTIILKIYFQDGKITFLIQNSDNGMSKDMIDDFNLQFQYYAKSLTTIKRSWYHKLGTTLMVTNKLVHLLSGFKDQLIISEYEGSVFKFSILQEIGTIRQGSEFGIGSISSDRSEIHMLYNHPNFIDEVQEDQIVLEPHCQQIKLSVRSHRPSQIMQLNQQSFNPSQSKHSQKQQNTYHRSSSVFDVNSFLRQFSSKDQGIESNQELIADKDSYILIVDDEPFNHDTLVMMLKRIGYTQFLHAFNGEDCITKVLEKNNKIKLILMDLDMPIMNGFKATQKIIEMMKQKTIKIFPIIACTAHDDFDTEQECLRIGMHAIIVKPVFLKQLSTVLKNLPKNFDIQFNF